MPAEIQPPCRLYSAILIPMRMLLTSAPWGDTVEGTYIARGGSPRLGGPLKVARPPGSPMAALAMFWGQ
jgi:hypothetical protein